MIPTPENIAKMKAEEAKEKLKNLAKIKNSLVEALVKKNNHTALKILFFLSKDIVGSGFVAETHGDNMVNITVDVKTLCDYTGLTTKTINRNLIKMQETTISFYDEKYEEHISLLPRVKINYGGTLEIDMYPKVFNLIFEARNKYTSIDLTNLMKLKSKHSIRMIMLLEYISGFSEHVAKSKTFLLEELNGMFGTDYKRTVDFVRYIIEPVKKELDSISKLSFVYSLHLDKDDITRGGRPSAKGINIFLTDNHNPQPSLL